MTTEKLLKKVIEQKTKFIVVTGGVCSSLGKGILVSSIGVLLKNSGYSLSVIKWDPYLNVDPGTMSPLVHGEVFVTNDGAETDLDLGHYERLLEVHLHKDSSVSSGQIFKEILDKEREGKFLGRDIQVVPHVVDAIKDRLLNFALKTKVDFVLLEIGGTVGDMEGISFLESIRQLKMQLSDRQLMLCHLSLVPYLNWANEIKTKPTQHSVMMLKKVGLTPDALFLRSDKHIEKKQIEKLSVMCGVHKNLIFEALTFNPIYNIFLDLQKQELNKRIQNWFGIKKTKEADLTKWEKLIELIQDKKGDLKIALVAKYVGSNDPYLSIVKALEAACTHAGYALDLEIIEAEKLENCPEKNNSAWKILKSASGIVVPGGFDARGILGKILAVQWARENKIPYLGLCLGMQVMLIEFARHVLKFKDASSTEFDKQTKHPVISLLEEQLNIEHKGGTMRLGAYKCLIKKDTLAYNAYGKTEIIERHRHRYEFNNKYKKDFEKAGVVFSGIFKEKDLVEISEIKDHPFMLGCQFHPEFLSSPLKSHPLFKAFVDATLKNKKSE
ncbi:CTP synthase [Candidatus Babeliales bacterium]|nr:CTP synthase [Candidatus Babeliales bacterium]